MTRSDLTPQSPVRDLMSRPVAMVSLGDSLEHVAEELAANAIGAVMVSTETHCVGIITERDLIEHLGNGGNLQNLTAEEVLSSDLVTITPQTSVGEAARQMVEAGIRHLPVEEDEDVVGLISARDALAVLVGSLGS